MFLLTSAKFFSFEPVAACSEVQAGRQDRSVALKNHRAPPAYTGPSGRIAYSELLLRSIPILVGGTRNVVHRSQLLIRVSESRDGVAIVFRNRELFFSLILS